MLILNLIAQATTNQFGSGLTSGTAFDSGLAKVDTENPLNALETLLSQVIGLVTVVAGLIFILMFLNGAFGWISAGGDSGKVQKSRDAMVHAVLGLIVMVAGYALIGLIGSIVGIDILNPAIQIQNIINATPTTP